VRKSAVASLSDEHASVPPSVRREHLPTFTVVIPCYNYGRYLTDCVESVLSQLGVEVRVLIIDDASTDSTPQIASAFAARDQRVEFHRHDRNLGHIATYNEGLSLADSTYSVLLDADDMLTPGSLERASNLMEAYPHVGLVYGHPLLFRDDQPPPLPITAPVRWRIWPGKQWFEIRCRLIENCIRSPEAVMRTDLFRRVGGFRKELPHSGDLELWMRFALQSDIGYIAGPDQALYRDHHAGMHRANFAHALADHEQIDLAFKLLFRDCAYSIANHRRLAARVRSRLATRALRLAYRAYESETIDRAEALALEAYALNERSFDIRGLETRARLRLRKKLTPGSWRVVRSSFNVMTIVPRRWDHFQYLRRQRDGLLL